MDLSLSCRLQKGLSPMMGMFFLKHHMPSLSLPSEPGEFVIIYLVSACGSHRFLFFLLQ